MGRLEYRNGRRFLDGKPMVIGEPIKVPLGLGLRAALGVTSDEKWLFGTYATTSHIHWPAIRIKVKSGAGDIDHDVELHESVEVYRVDRRPWAAAAPVDSANAGAILRKRSVVWTHVTQGRCWNSRSIPNVTLAIHERTAGYQSGVQGEGSAGDVVFTGPVRDELEAAQRDAELLAAYLLTFAFDSGRIYSADQHLAVCQQCSDHRFDLCPTGRRLRGVERAEGAERMAARAGSPPTKGGQHVD